ncbi:hypothetical protein F4811DRAFT_472518 [Daldinia bambusicola]|nr:hypothetical protein F4811DRAFT_472518 [Daldinia bambusicola]
MDVGGIHYNHCDPPAPQIFYCSSDTKCIVLAANTTVLCCPNTSEEDCINIDPIACDLNQQTSLASIQTTVREGKLYTCGTGCCPWGYHCGDDNTCYRDADQSKPPLPLRVTTNLIIDHTSTSSSVLQSSLPQSVLTTFDTSFIPYSSGVPSISIAPIAGPTPETDQTAEPSDSTLSKGAIAGISVASFCAVVLAGLGVWFLRRMRKSTKDSSNDEKNQNSTSLDSKESAKLPDTYGELHGTPVFELSG